MKVYIFIFITLIVGIYTQEVSYTTNLLDSPLMGVIWCGNNQINDAKVLGVSVSGILYKSVDRGFSWTDMTQTLSGQISKSQANSKNKKLGNVDQMHQSPTNTNLVIIQTNEKKSFITNDCGDTFYNPPNIYHLREFQFHPSNSQFLLASAWTSCDKQDKDCIVTKMLYLSQDGGRGWRKIADFVVQFGWAYKPNQENNMTPQNRIIYSQDEDQKQHQSSKGWKDTVHLYYTDDFTTTKQQLLEKGNKFLIEGNFILVAQFATQGKVNLLFADITRKDYIFRYAQIPEELDQSSFTVLDSNEGDIFLNINKMGKDSDFGAVYKSTAEIGKFVKVLDNNVRNSQGQCDFLAIDGILGVHIANTYTQSVVEEAIYQINTEDSLENQISQKVSVGQKNQRNVGSLQKMLKQNIVTQISFDMGSQWQQIQAPIRDSLGKNIFCRTNEGCSLHLHNYSSNLNYGPVYSSPNAHGIIMGTGNIGQNLQFLDDQVNTYLSRDAGLTWYEVKKGSYIYEFADHGGLILMAENKKKTNKIYYSWDEGMTWDSIKFLEEEIQVTNIITEPSNVGQKFIVLGKAEIQNRSSFITKGVTVSLDFSTLHQIQCQGAESPGTIESDYEYWSPNGLSQPDCLLGAKRMYARRKRSAQCYNGQEFERQYSVTPCECVESDWECDYGFERANNGQGQCIYTSDQDFSTLSLAPEVCEGYYTVTKGYRKINGDQCIRGVDYSPYVYTCPYFGFGGSNFLVNLLILVGLGFLINYIYKNQDKSREVAQQLISLLQNTISSFNINLPKFLAKKEKGGYLDYSDYDFEKGGLGGAAFDDTLVSHQDDDHEQGNKQTSQKIDNLQLESNHNNDEHDDGEDLLRVDVAGDHKLNKKQELQNKNSNQNKKENNQTEKKQQASEEVNNLLDADSQDDDGFDI